MEKSIPIGQINMPSDIRAVNELRVMELFRSGGTLTAPEIQSATGISKPTIMKILQHLCSQGIIRSAGTGSSTSAGGKKPELYTFADDRLILSIAFWPKSTALALSGLVGEVGQTEIIEHELGTDLDAEILWLSAKLRTYLRQKGVTLSSLYGAVISTSGTVDYHDLILRYNSQAPSWGSNVHLRKYLIQHLGSLPMYTVENAGKITGRAALVDDPSLNDQRVLTIFTTWGVSGCLIECGRVLNGKDFLIGEIGHMTVSDDDTELCGCGRTGCLERMVSIEHTRKLAEQLGTHFAKENPLFGFDDLFELSMQGDGDARKLVRRLAHYFAIMLHNISLVYNPDVVVFQGNFAFADAFFDKCLRVELGTFRYNAQESLRILYDRSPLEQQAAKGAADMIRRIYFSSTPAEGK